MVPAVNRSLTVKPFHSAINTEVEASSAEDPASQHGWHDSFILRFRPAFAFRTERREPPGTGRLYWLPTAASGLIE